jgi:hypothetical protein
MSSTVICTDRPRIACLPHPQLSNDFGGHWSAICINSCNRAAFCDMIPSSPVPCAVPLTSARACVFRIPRHIRSLGLTLKRATDLTFAESISGVANATLGKTRPKPSCSNRPPFSYFRDGFLPFWGLASSICLDQGKNQRRRVPGPSRLRIGAWCWRRVRGSLMPRGARWRHCAADTGIPSTCTCAERATGRMTHRI